MNTRHGVSQDALGCCSLRVTVDLAAFVHAAVPLSPARVLEVGCGPGALARALDAMGYDVVAIDPQAPEGPIFRRTTLEEFDETGAFDAAVASYALHHIDRLDRALDRIAALLTPEGKLVIEEFGWDRVDQATAGWYGQQRGASSSIDVVLAEWEAEHEGLHGYAQMKHALEKRFAEDFFEWRPYLYRCLERDDVEPTEHAAIRAGDIQAVGFRYVGKPR
jgi:SAM-dependent methyltransferase